jgi:hypothetical protein
MPTQRKGENGMGNKKFGSLVNMIKNDPNRSISNCLAAEKVELGLDFSYLRKEDMIQVTSDTQLALVESETDFPRDNIIVRWQPSIDLYTRQLRMQLFLTQP